MSDSGLNARLPEELARKLGAALERYFNEVCGPGRSTRDTIRGSGLVGCGEADADLSATSKPRLHEGFGRKHGHR